MLEVGRLADAVVEPSLCAIECPRRSASDNGQRPVPTGSLGGGVLAH
jgi:hypothetical protein